MPNVNQRRTVITCTNCRLNRYCLPAALNKSDIKQLEAIVEHNCSYEKGDHLYRQKANFKSVYVVRSGSFKSYAFRYNGKGRVNGFFFPGEIIGMDGISDRSHINAVQALEHAFVCEIPFSKLESLSLQIPDLQHHLFALMGKEITNDREFHNLLSSYTAEERTAHFLINLSSRYERVSLSPFRLLLPMTRGDIGEYLGLSLETISRMFGKLHCKGLIAVNNREIELLQMEPLLKIAGC
ncbi:MAG: helix-turn-helix domain-containing protein, partial [Pseudomonadales bacterium]|nr:helix-turn-helix domain-containing protein [Pseudomonadales bacterium]